MAEVDDILLEWSVLPEVVEIAAGESMSVTEPAGVSTSSEKVAGVSSEE